MTTRHLEIPDRAVLTQGMIDVMREHIPGWEADESDPGVYWADEHANQLIQLAHKVNNAADATFILTAEKPAIYDHLTEVGVNVTGELQALSVEELRELYFNVWKGLSKDVPDYFIQLIKQIYPATESVSHNNRLSENEIDIYVAGVNSGNFPASDRDAIQTFMNLRQNKPIWITYLVKELTITPYVVNASVKYRRGTRSPQLTVDTNSEVVIRELRKAGEGVALSALSQGMWAEGVIDIDFTSPAADLPASPDTIYHGVVGVVGYVEV